MKWSPVLHGVAAIAAFLGLLSLFGAWIATSQGSFFGLSEEHLFNDTMSLLLVSVTFGIATLVNIHQEKRRR